jgi:hypothetical protein
MTELLVPFSIAFALAQACRDARWRAVLYVGVCLPQALSGILRLQGASPPSLAHPLQSPVGAIAWCLVGAFLFEEDWRARAFAALVAGAGIHLAVDALAAPPGSGRGIFWAFPVSGQLLELGWIPDLSPGLLRAGAAVVLVVAAIGARRRGRGPAG